MISKRFSALIVFFLTVHGLLSAATVDTISIRATAMNKTYKAAIALPQSYAKSRAVYPVLYLLHGGFGHFTDWLTLTPDKESVKKLCDQYNMIIVMPEGETFSWYLDSPVDSGSRFETYITRDLIAAVDKNYRTVAGAKSRAITGLSMGGHGALYLSARHPALFSAAGSMSGALDLDWSKLDIDAEFLKTVKESFQALLGSVDPSNEVYYKNSVVNFSETMKKNALPMIIDCGTDDFLIELNREFHHRLLYNHTQHDYTERPGGHTWDYWQNSLPYHALFFYKVFATNKVAVTDTVHK